MQCKMKVLEDVNAYSDTEKRENIQDYLLVTATGLEPTTT